MQNIEAEISSLLRTCISGVRPRGLIQCQAEEGVSGYTGEIETGRFMRRSQSLVTLLDNSPRDPHSPNPRPEFADLLAQLREASWNAPQGPWYRCNIQIDGPTMRFVYYWENAPFRSVKELEPSLDGCVPNFVFARRFDRDLVAELSEFELNSALFYYVPERIKAGKGVSEPLLEVFTSLEWQSDTNNGGLNQYFSREYEPLTGLKRSALYVPTYRGLLRIGHAPAATLFAEALSIYAAYYPRIEAACQELGLPVGPKVEETDLMDRYEKLERSLDPARAGYIRKQIAELEQQPD